MNKKPETKKTATEKPTYHIENCSITNTVPPANEHTRAAVEALAKALEANAVALGDTAKALRGGNATIENGIRVGA